MIARSAPLLRLLRHARGHRGRLLQASAASVLKKIFDLAPPLLIGAAVDVVVQREKSFLAGLGVTDVYEQIVWLGVLTLVIWGLESLFEYAHAVLWRNLAQTIEHELRLDTYVHVQRLDLARFEDRSTGSFMAVLNDDINQLERFLDGGANDLLQVGTTVVVIGAIFFTLAPEIAWLAFLPIPVILWGSFRFQRRLTPRYALVRERVDHLNGVLANNLSGIATIKSFTAEAFEAARVADASRAYREANRSAISLSSAFSPLIRMAIVVGFVLTLVLGGRAVLEGTLAVGAYSVMIFFTQRLLWPLTRLGHTIDLYQRAMASTTRALDLLNTRIHVSSGRGELPVRSVRGEIVFENVTHAYGPDQAVVREISFRVGAGETVALVGATGSGKSTLVKLLLRFYEPLSGRILVGGRDLSSIRLAELRRAIGFVSQEVFLFHGTVRENIAYGSFDASNDAIEAAARAAEAHAFVEKLPSGYDTIVGERGQKLSGGQRQRISIARAVLKNPPVLVLDEATSAVDNETEAAIQRSLSTITRGRTTIVIAHRLSTIRHADRIHVLEDGRIVESGTHETLIGGTGAYATFWRVQTGEATTAPPAPHAPR